MAQARLRLWSQRWRGGANRAGGTPALSQVKARSGFSITSVMSDQSAVAVRSQYPVGRSTMRSSSLLMMRNGVHVDCGSTFDRLRRMQAQDEGVARAACGLPP
jgi:hypothetical protein